MGTLEQLKDFSPEKSGEYYLDLWASWDGREEGFAGLTGYRISLTYEREILLAIDRQEVPQGYCVILRASNLPFTPTKGSRSLFFPPSTAATPGSTTLPLPPGRRAGTLPFRLPTAGLM